MGFQQGGEGMAARRPYSFENAVKAGVVNRVSTATVGSLFVGSLHEALNPAWLSLNKISLVHTAMFPQGDWPEIQRQLYRRLGVNHVHHALLDIPEQLMDWRRLSLEDIHSYLIDGHNVLVHCHRGVSRSVAVVLAYLIIYERIPADEALLRIRIARPIANPNPGFWQQLCVLSDAYTDKRMKRSPQPKAKQEEIPKRHSSYRRKDPSASEATVSHQRTLSHHQRHYDIPVRNCDIQTAQPYYYEPYGNYSSVNYSNVFYHY